jgi:hypothetical protein
MAVAMIVVDVDLREIGWKCKNAVKRFINHADIPQAVQSDCWRFTASYYSNMQREEFIEINSHSCFDTTT